MSFADKVERWCRLKPESVVRWGYHHGRHFDDEGEKFANRDHLVLLDDEVDRLDREIIAELRGLAYLHRGRVLFVTRDLYGFECLNLNLIYRDPDDSDA